MNERNNQEGFQLYEKIDEKGHRIPVDTQFELDKRHEENPDIPFLYLYKELINLKAQRLGDTPIDYSNKTKRYPEIKKELEERRRKRSTEENEFNINDPLIPVINNILENIESDPDKTEREKMEDMAALERIIDKSQVQTNLLRDKMEILRFADEYITRGIRIFSGTLVLIPAIQIFLEKYTSAAEATKLTEIINTSEQAAPFLFMYLGTVVARNITVENMMNLITKQDLMKEKAKEESKQFSSNKE